MAFMNLFVHVNLLFDNIFSRCVLVHRRIAIIVSINIIMLNTYTIIIPDSISVIFLDDSIISFWRRRILNLIVTTY